MMPCRKKAANPSSVYFSGPQGTSKRCSLHIPCRLVTTVSVLFSPSFHSPQLSAVSGKGRMSPPRTITRCRRRSRGWSCVFSATITPGIIPTGTTFTSPCHDTSCTSWGVTGGAPMLSSLMSITIRVKRSRRPSHPCIPRRTLSHSDSTSALALRTRVKSLAWSSDGFPSTSHSPWSHKVKSAFPSARDTSFPAHARFIPPPATVKSTAGSAIPTKDVWYSAMLRTRNRCPSDPHAFGSLLARARLSTSRTPPAEGLASGSEACFGGVVQYAISGTGLKNRAASRKKRVGSVRFSCSPWGKVSEYCAVSAWRTHNPCVTVEVRAWDAIINASSQPSVSIPRQPPSFGEQSRPWRRSPYSFSVSGRRSCTYLSRALMVSAAMTLARASGSSEAGAAASGTFAALRRTPQGRWGWSHRGR
eukprot:Sspe_Gene.29274::Locus_13802_Transcript_2_2_Confidence_0.667_Length_3299::g.29274::m.29274